MDREDAEREHFAQVARDTFAELKVITTERDTAIVEREDARAERDRLAAALADRDAQVTRVRAALADLVRLKDGLRDERYEREKPLAWERARRALTPGASPVSGGIADTLAAHQPGAFDFGSNGWSQECSCGHWVVAATADDAAGDAAFAAHQAEVLSSAGYGELSALLDDLRMLADLYASMPGHQPRAALLVGELRTLARRYAPSDPTPKEQQR